MKHVRYISYIEHDYITLFINDAFEADEADEADEYLSSYSQT